MKQVCFIFSTVLFNICLSSVYAQTVKDIDGNEYNTITIGNQIWLAENLKTTTYNDGTPITNVKPKSEWASLETGAYAFYNNELDSGLIYGALYNWYAVETNKVCPSGWHVPSDEEWKELEMTLGMTHQQADLRDSHERGVDQGSQLAGNGNLWRDWTGEGGLERNKNFGTSGFAALPGGYRSEYGRDGFINARGMWWTTSTISDNIGNSYPLHRAILGGPICTVYRNYSNKKSGLSVRCVKD